MRSYRGDRRGRSTIATCERGSYCNDVNGKCVASLVEGDTCNKENSGCSVGLDCDIYADDDDYDDFWICVSDPYYAMCE